MHEEPRSLSLLRACFLIFFCSLSSEVAYASGDFGSASLSVVVGWWRRSVVGRLSGVSAGFRSSAW
jgi:hypothetical protein